MKKIGFLILAATFVFALTSCGNKANNKIEGTDAQAVANGEGVKLAVDSTQSVIEWVGSKVGGKHNGTLAIKNGEITVNDSTIVAGTFTIDMKTVKALDQGEEMNKKLAGHLMSADFFDVENNPEASFSITAAQPVTNNDSLNIQISGNLTLKGIEKNITFKAKATKEGDTYKAVSEAFTIDRTQFGIVYKSKSTLNDIKEAFINDEIELKITIVAKAAN